MSEEFLQAIGALIFVIGLMIILALLAKKFGLAGALPSNSNSKRLSVVESIPLDTRRRAVILKRDDVEHLVILGAQNEIVVETGIKTSEK